MSETTHVLEELRTLSNRLSDVYGEMRELVVELRHAQKSYENLNERVLKIETDIRSIQLENATNKPIMDIAKRMYYSQWVTIGAAAAGTVGMNWTRLFGG